MDYAQQLADFAHILEQKRLVTALEGNASVIDRQTGLTYVTPSGRMKLLLEKEDICVMNAAGEQIGGRGRRSSEHLLHEAVYQARPDVTAVVHSHCPFLTAYALRYQNFDVPETCSLREVFTHFTCLPYGKPGTDEIYAKMGPFLKNHNIVLLGNHGPLSVGPDLATAFNRMDSSERIARIINIAKSVGELSDLPDYEIARLFE